MDAAPVTIYPSLRVVMPGIMSNAIYSIGALAYRSVVIAHWRDWASLSKVEVANVGWGGISRD